MKQLVKKNVQRKKRIAKRDAKMRAAKLKLEKKAKTA